MHYTRIAPIFLCILCLTSFKSPVVKEIVVKNNLNYERKEIVTVPISFIRIKSKEIPLLEVYQNSKIVISQLIDMNGDSTYDQIVFQATIGANETQTYKIQVGSKKATAPSLTHSRYVPERIDDFAWENNLVAFRTYGPEAQRLVDQNEKGGTLSSGLDCWLKRVDYPIIDKWYKKYVDGGSYHKDDQNEGYDPYHVGASRGCGGIGVWKNDSLYVSKNFISYRKIAEGPLRNIFTLTYAPWKVDDVTIQETKQITLDVGSQLYMVEEFIHSSGSIPNVTVGITLHDKKGVTSADSTKAWFSYWESIDDSELGTGVVIRKGSLIKYIDYRTPKKDLSQLYVLARMKSPKLMSQPSQLVYYTGFGWKKAGVITSKDIWNNYLDKFSERISSPLWITFK
ncbi:MAG: DUF4861 domain-containing protein [Cyclobacteriaceae bacterium]|nr:DUF4861 domain-containing protein [Cyclobacteriaceae bacterium]